MPEYSATIQIKKDGQDQKETVPKHNVILQINGDGSTGLPIKQYPEMVADSAYMLIDLNKTDFSFIEKDGKIDDEGSQSTIVLLHPKMPVVRSSVEGASAQIDGTSDVRAFCTLPFLLLKAKTIIMVTIPKGNMTHEQLKHLHDSMQTLGINSMEGSEDPAPPEPMWLDLHTPPVPDLQEDFTKKQHGGRTSKDHGPATRGWEGRKGRGRGRGGGRARGRTSQQRSSTTNSRLPNSITLTDPRISREQLDGEFEDTLRESAGWKARIEAPTWTAPRKLEAKSKAPDQHSAAVETRNDLQKVVEESAGATYVVLNRDDSIANLKSRTSSDTFWKTDNNKDQNRRKWFGKTDRSHKTGSLSKGVSTKQMAQRDYSAGQEKWKTFAASNQLAMKQSASLSPGKELLLDHVEERGNADAANVNANKEKQATSTDVANHEFWYDKKPAEKPLLMGGAFYYLDRPRTNPPELLAIKTQSKNETETTDSQALANEGN